MDSWKTNRVLWAVLTVPAAAWLLVFFLVPLGLIWTLSFSQQTGLIERELTWTLENYARAFEPVYLDVLWQSLWVAAATTLICLLAGFPVALLIAFAPGRWKMVLLLLIILPFWTNLLIRTYALMTVLRTYGYVNFTLEFFWDIGDAALAFAGLGGLGPFRPLQLLFTESAVVFGLVYVHLPFMVLPLYAAIERLDKSYLEASLDLGAGQWRTLFAVTVPLTMPGITTGVLITFIPALGAFATPNLLGGPDSNFIGNVIAAQFGTANNPPFGMALAFLLMYATFGAIALRAVLAGRRRGSGD